MAPHWSSEWEVRHPAQDLLSMEPTAKIPETVTGIYSLDNDLMTIMGICHIPRQNFERQLIFHDQSS